jgi:tocopherol cyclase
VIYGIRGLQGPVFFQGNLHAKRCFEGWYFKHVSAGCSSLDALIPGSSLSPQGSQSLIQFIDGSNGRTRWFPFPLGVFGFSRDHFAVRIGDNRFSLEGIQAGLTYSGVGGRRVDSSDGRGYIEKDWGRSFPRAWIWAQSNTFTKPGTSFLFSLARVVSARLAGRELDIEVQDRGLRLQLHVERSHEGVLLGPVDGAMDRRIGESIDARLRVHLSHRNGTVPFDGTGGAAGLEAVGDLSLIGVETPA